MQLTPDRHTIDDSGAASEPPDAELRTVTDLLSSLVHLVRATRIGPAGVESLTPVQWATLTMVAHRGELRVSAIAEHMRVDLSVASRQIALLEDLGCVTRRADPADRRALLVTISPMGAERLSVMKKARADWLTTALDGWTPAQVHETAVAVDRLQEAIWAHTAHP